MEPAKLTEGPPDIGVPHYRVLSRLGAGGMGEVWLAEDARLGRKVAIKLLPAHATRNEESVRRFVQEARAASALNHARCGSARTIPPSSSFTTSDPRPT